MVLGRKANDPGWRWGVMPHRNDEAGLYRFLYIADMTIII